MEPSRDDFIIAIRSAFLKKGNKQRFSLLGLLFFSVTLIILGKINFQAINYLKIGIKELVYRTSFVVSLPEKYFAYSIDEIYDHINLYKDYSIKKKELEKIKSEKYETQFLISENKRLKKVLEDISFSENTIIAKALIDKQSPFLRSIIINKGSKDNILKGMAVLHEHYLIGKIVEVNYMTSRVLLISDLNSKIPVTIEPQGVQSILSGNDETSGLIQYMKERIKINTNSVVYTSGTGELLKAGIPIGKIKQNEKNYKVDFFVDFSQIRYVKVLSYNEEIN